VRQEVEATEATVKLQRRQSIPYRIDSAKDSDLKGRGVQSGTTRLEWTLEGRGSSQA
jgi:hypothetical protein